MVMCFAPYCKHYSERNGCKFFTFPKDPEEKAKWVKLLRRKDRTPSKNHRVCSCHFVDKCKSNGPTLSFGEPPKKKRKANESSPAETNILETNAEPEPNDENVDITNFPIPGPSWRADVGNDSPVQGPSSRTVVDRSTSPVPGPPTFSALYKAEIYFLEKEVTDLKDKLKGDEEKLTFKSIEKNEKLLHHYTGLPSKHIFMCLFNLIDKCEINYVYFNVEKIEKIDQLLLTLMKLRLNLTYEDLAYRFKISLKTVGNIFKTFLYALHEILFLDLMSEIPTTSKNKLCLPSSFSSFTNCRVVLDCTEIPVAHPKNMEKQRATYSAYKHNNTLKGLIGVAPNGVVVFASSLYPGSTSDKNVVEDCEILSKLHAGDLILADKGFLIKDMLPPGVNLNIPPFLTTSQFTPEQVIMTRTIARARIHVERAIRRIKCYRILNVVPQTLIPHSSTIFQLCAALTNLQFPLIKEVEDLYLT